MEARLMLKHQAEKAAKGKCGEGLDCCGLAQKKGPGGEKRKTNTKD